MAEPIKLSIKPLSSSERKKRRIDGLAVSLDDKDPKFLPANSPHSVLINAASLISPRSSELKKEDVAEIRSDRDTTVLRSDRSTTDLLERIDLQSNAGTLDGSPTYDIQPKAPQFDEETGDDHNQPSAAVNDQASIPLSEMQWLLWQELQRLSQNNQRTCFQELVATLKQKRRGLQRAVEALKKEGAIKLHYVRTKEFQGFSVEINPDIRFHVGSQKEVYGLIKRGLTVVPRHHGQTVVPWYSERNKYVCKKNTHILGDDLRLLLENAPAEWKIREQTLVQIADAFPMMTALEFRLSLRRLVDQAKNGKQVIQNPNAWLKASFERNGGPLVTEREIEVRVRQHEANVVAPPQTRSQPLQPEAQDVETMRRYMNASLEERRAIDQLAEEKVGRLLATISSDKHAGVLEEARLECTREYFGAKAKTGQG